MPLRPTWRATSLAPLVFGLILSCSKSKDATLEGSWANHQSVQRGDAGAVSLDRFWEFRSDKTFRFGTRGVANIPTCTGGTYVLSDDQKKLTTTSKDSLGDSHTVTRDVDLASSSLVISDTDGVNAYTPGDFPTDLKCP
jgi:hypothetical protein